MTTRVYPELPPPDVEVLVEATTVTPTVLTPMLPACIVAPCYQIVEVTEDGEPNLDSLISLPAIVESATAMAPAVQYAVNGLTCILKVNGGSSVTKLFGANKTPAEAATELNAQFVTSHIDSLAIAEVVTDPTSTTIAPKVRLQIRTKASGLGQTIELLGGTGHTALFMPLYWTAIGMGSYDQFRAKVSTESFPAPRDNMDQLDFDPDYVTVAIDEGGGQLRELSTDSCAERIGQNTAGAGLTFIDDGDADGMTNRIQLADASIKDEFGNSNVGVGNVSTAATAAIVTASAIPDYPSIVGKTLIMSVCGSPFQTILFGACAAIADLYNTINKWFPGLAAADGGGTKLALSTGTLTPGFQNLATKGREAFIVIHKNSTAVTSSGANPLDNGAGSTINTGILKLNAAANDGCGGWYPVLAGDEFWFDGVKVGNVSRIVSAGATSVIELDTEISESTVVTDKWWHFVSKNLTGCITSTTAPTPEVYVTQDGEVHVKQNILRSAYGVPFWRYMTPAASDPYFYGTAPLYIGYKALRLDVTAEAEEPTLLSFDSTTEIQDEIGPISSDNPLPMGCYLAKLSCPSRTLYGLGVGETDASAPDGTLAGYTSAAGVLANNEVYTIVPKSQDKTVRDMFAAHVADCSSVDNKLERCLFSTVEIPTRGPSIALESGSGGAKVAPLVFNTGVPALTALLVAAGVDPSDTDLTSPDVGLYLNIETNALNYHILSVSGSTITMKIEVAHDFYSGTDFTALSLINEQHSVMLRGSLLVTGTGAPDKTAIAQALADTASGYDSNRIICACPGECNIVDNSLVTRVSSFYAACVEAGKRAEAAPHIGFTNTTTPYITSLFKSNNYFSKTQMNIAAAGGIWWWIQETAASPVTVRHQLTTDTTTVESREWNLTTAVDYLAKMIRLQIRPMLGKFVINEDLLRLVDAALDGIRMEVVDNRNYFSEVVFGELTIPEDEPDTVEVIVDVVRYYPFNKLRARIRV